MPSKMYFSDFTPDEQRLAIDLEKRRAAWTKTKESAEKTNVAAGQRLAATPYFAEVLTLPGLPPDAVAQITEAHSRYLQLQEQNLAAGRAQYLAAEQQWSGLSPQLQQHANAVSAVINFEQSNRVTAEVDQDCPPPDELNDGIYGYEQILRRELEETRMVVAANKPELLGQYQFKVAEESIDFGGAGKTVAAAADELRAARILLRTVRQLAQPAA